MCENASWIEKNGEVLFLDDDDLRSKRGKELKEYLGRAYDEDRVGHGAIEWFYDVNGGSHLERTDFSTPNNFPTKLVDAIKNGKRTMFGLPRNHEKMLNKYGLKAYADWKKANADWQKAYADYQKADADRQKANAKIFWKVFADKKNRSKAWK